LEPSPSVETRIFQAFVGVQVLVGSESVFRVSGFMIEVDGWMVWVTASHCLEGLDKLEEQHPDAKFLWLFPAHPTDLAPCRSGEMGAVRVDRMAALSLASGKRKGRRAVRDLSKMADEHRGCDIAYVPLSEYHQRVARSAGVVPFGGSAIGEESLIRDTVEGGVLTCVAGLPVEGVDPVRQLAALVVLPVKLAPVGTKPGRRLNPLFLPLMAPDWSRDVYDGDIVGMSGGPCVIVHAKGVFAAGVVTERIGREGRTPKAIICNRLEPALLMIREHLAILARGG